MTRAADEKTALGSVWLRPEPAAPRAPLDRDDVVRAAVGLLDRDGLDRLSMRRLAAELGTAATSALYWRVAGKDDLLELAVDAVLAEALAEVHTDTGAAAAPAARRDWRDDAGELALAAYDAFARHPWAAQLLASHAGLGPHYQAYAERLVGVLAAAGFKGVHLDAAVVAVFHYVVGAAVTDAAWIATVRRSGLEEGTWARAAGDRLGVAAASLSAYLSRDDEAGPRARFTSGLRALLVGLRPRRLS